MDGSGRSTIEISHGDLHQIRNRLTVVKGLAQLLQRHLNRDDWSSNVIASKVAALLDEIEAMERSVYQLDHGPSDASLSRQANGNHGAGRTVDDIDAG